MSEVQGIVPDIELGLNQDLPKQAESNDLKRVIDKYNDFLFWNKKENQTFGDEYTNGNLEGSLKPLDKVVYTATNKRGKEVTVDLTEYIQKDMDYLARTADLETSGVRVKTLQDCVDKMLDGTNKKMRVVIMNKGGTNAFVTPDGTIFISQSLINEINGWEDGGMDAVVAVLAHEVGHGILETSKQMVMSAIGEETGDFGGKIKSKIMKIGVAWKHEMGADAQLALMAKAGYNPTAYATMIQRIGKDRSDVHQSGDARASMSVAQLNSIHFEESGNELKPIDEILLKDSEKTNMEMFGDLVAKDDLERAVDMIPLMHPKDAGVAIEKIYEVCGNKKGFLDGEKIVPSKVLSKYEKANQRVNDLVISRLMESGVSEKDAKIFLFAFEHRGRNRLAFNRYLFSSPEELISAIDGIENFGEPGGWGEKVFSVIFDNNSEVFNYKEFSNKDIFNGNVASNLRNSLYDLFWAEGGFFDDGDFVLCVKKLMKNMDMKDGKTDNYAGSPVYALVLDYLLNVYVSKAGVDFDREHVGLLLDDLKVKKDGDSILDQYGLGIGFYKHVKFMNDSSDQNYQVLAGLVKEMFYVDEKKLTTEELYARANELVDSFESKVDDVVDLGPSTLGLIVNLLSEFKELDLYSKLTREQSLGIVNRIYKNVSKFYMPGNVDVLVTIDESDGNINKFITKDDVDRGEINTALFRFKMMQLTAIFLMDDCVERYDFLDKITNELAEKVDLNVLSVRQLFFLAQPLIVESGIRTLDGQGIGVLNILGDVRGKFKDFERLEKNALVIAMFKKELDSQPQDVVELLSLLDHDTNFFNHVSRWYNDNRRYKFDVFGNNPVEVWYGNIVRPKIAEMVERGISKKDYPVWKNLIYSYFPENNETKQVLRAIEMNFLSDKSVDFWDRVDFALDNFDSLGVEGSFILAKEIKSIEQYEEFRKRFADKKDKVWGGSDALSFVAAADNVIAMLGDTRNEESKMQLYKDILLTVDRSPEAVKLNSQKLYKKWTTIFKYSLAGFDTPSEKMNLSGSVRSLFRTFGDVHRRLAQTTNGERMSLVFKSLTENGGMLSSDENRKELALMIVKGLGMKDGFLAEMTKKAVLSISPKFASFPLTKMIAPLLFSGVDTNSVDYLDGAEMLTFANGKRLDSDYPVERFKNFVNSKTREVVSFGSRYGNFGGRFESGALSNYTSYEDMMQVVSREFFDKTNVDVVEKDNSANLAVDGLIGAAEVVGGMPIRGLQLLGQLHRFKDKQTQERVGRASDSNNGMEELWIWENIYRMIENNRDDTKLVEMLRGAQIERKIAAGSMRTVCSGTILDSETGERKRVVFKFVNPNPEYFVEEAKKISDDIFIPMSKGFRYSKWAKVALNASQLAHEWCLKDLRDETFVEDDARYTSEVIDTYKPQNNEVTMRPRVYLHRVRITVEEEIGDGDGVLLADTARKVIASDGIDQVLTKRVARTCCEYYAHELKTAEKDASGVGILRSDPQMGNVMVKVTKSTEGVEILTGIIDRHMYLKIPTKDLEVMNKLLAGKPDAGFANEFVDMVLDNNKVRGLSRITAKTRLLVSAAASQVGGGGEDMDQFAKFDSLLTTMADMGIDLPLSYRLHLRNVMLYKKFAAENGIDMGQFFS